MKVEELDLSRASTTRQAFPSPSNCPNLSSGVIAGQHPVGVKPQSIHRIPLVTLRDGIMFAAIYQYLQLKFD